MRRSWVGFTTAVAVFVALPATAQVRSTIFGPGARKYPIAVSPLRPLSAGIDADAETFLQTLDRDLQLSGIFRVLPRDTHIEPAATSGTTVETINFQNWSVIGALAVVKGTIQREAGVLTLEAKLFDVTQRALRLGRRYRGASEDVPRMANRFADDVLAVFTG